MKSVAIVLAFVIAFSAPARAEKKIKRSDFITPVPMPSGSLLVIGLLGAWEDWDNPKRSVRKVALSLRAKSLPGVFVETAGNHSRRLVRQFVLDSLDSNRDRKLSAEEAAASPLILYGQSFGAAACVKLARELKKSGVRVRLIVMVDSIGRDDQVIPSNVKRALNFYQRDPGPVRGESSIRAEDPAQTSILGNVPFTYLFRDIDMSDYPRITRRAALSHWKMDNDPVVWTMVETAILAEITQSQFLPLP
jgi:pimeloyl-ACP methyl ester carboxylesterase